MRLLTAVDQLFLLLETRNQPMHIGGLFLFELPFGAKDNFVSELVELMRNSQIPPSFPFNQVLYRLLFWQTDKNFDVSHHFRHIALPKPANMDALLGYVSKEHAHLLDKSKPMWECHIIEGLHGNHFALYFKIHHAMVDGVAALQLVKKSLSQSPTEKISLPIWSLMTRHRHQLDALIPPYKSAWQIVKEQSLALPPVGRELFKNIYERFNKNYVSTAQAPDSLLNQPISSSRRIAVASFSFSRFQEIAKTHNATFNDVVLAVCAGALRRYLTDQHALPKKPLIGFVPLSLRDNQQKQHKIGNQITFILANLATHIQDPVERLHTINASTKNSKNRFARMNQASSILYSGVVYSRAGLQVLTGIMPEYRGFNLIISNVPATKKPLYWQGAKLKALYPVSVVINDQAMNITFCTYQDSIEFCIVACAKVLPNIDIILTYMQEEIDNF
ncbi:hypothetical protein MOMA_05691 [Moraxella macacae 0408225]|uniref:diacylglycerol O-acyltransferase n=1 Tax=Moraxella macacae 0408225 TaxID=1230338 RepID=L2F6F8_9GAMM|nr:wax ester/triacylglycerol synthase family O-acyltransferase [Moraxella macacae]ELA08028.1 hypothetical protein MOMA_05691 [Moraxella macacae 0408225]